MWIILIGNADWWWWTGSYIWDWKLDSAIYIEWFNTDSHQVKLKMQKSLCLWGILCVLYVAVWGAPTSRSRRCQR